MKHLLRLVPILGALTLPCVAQSAGSRVSVRLLAFHPGLSAPEVFLHDPSAPAETAATKAEIKPYLNHESSPLVLTGRKLVITTSADRASITRDGDLMGQASLPEGARSAILLFLPTSPGADAKAQVLVIEDSKKSFPAGSFRVSNLSPQAVRIVLETKNFDFKPGQTLLIEDPPVRSNQHSGMKAFAFTENEWRRIGSGLWPHPGTSRTLQILFHNPASGQVQMRAFDDVPPRDPEPEPVATP